MGLFLELLQVPGFANLQHTLLPTGWYVHWLLFKKSGRGFLSMASLTVLEVCCVTIIRDFYMLLEFHN